MKVWRVFVSLGAVAGLVAFYGVGKLYEHVYILALRVEANTEALGDVWIWAEEMRRFLTAYLGAY